MNKKVITERIFWKRIKTPIGKIFVGWTQRGIIEISFIQLRSLRDILIDLKEEGFKPFAVTGGRAVDQLVEYFKGNRKGFNCSLVISGTDFQKKVWNELLKIPYGMTRTYGDIAKAIKNPKATRAVGRAMGANRIAIIIPCHRVIGSRGKLIGYKAGIDKKRWLLYHEARHR